MMAVAKWAFESSEGVPEQLVASVDDFSETDEEADEPKVLPEAQERARHVLDDRPLNKTH